MELRSAENDLEELCKLYKDLRRGHLEQKLPPLMVVASGDTTDVVDSSTTPDGSQSASEVLKELETIRERLQALQGTMDRFKKRMMEKDSVTNKPRYGEKTMSRVKTLLETYEDLQKAIALVFGEAEVDATATIHHLRNHADQEEEVKKAKEREEQERQDREKARKEAEELRIAEEHRKAEEAERQELERQREELARQAEAARMAQLRAQQAVERADREWVESIEKGTNGVREQLQILIESTKDDPPTQRAAINALHTLFSQIVSRPEETIFRRIRRDHPRFNEDIGRHPGGKEFVIASGFVLGAIDDVPSYISKEPNIEKDMDGWSAWFDLLKATLAIIEEELMK
jgi:DNA repair exonuclease SbcCD ATPase subunit